MFCNYIHIFIGNCIKIISESKKSKDLFSTLVKIYKIESLYHSNRPFLLDSYGSALAGRLISFKPISDAYLRLAT